MLLRHFFNWDIRSPDRWSPPQPPDGLARLWDQLSFRRLLECGRDGHWKTPSITSWCKGKVRRGVLCYGGRASPELLVGAIPLSFKMCVEPCNTLARDVRHIVSVDWLTSPMTS